MISPPEIRFFLVPDVKVHGYLLDLDHPVGGPKARFFLGRGFSLERPGDLTEALRLPATSGATISRQASSAAGDPLLVLEGPLGCPGGSEPLVRAVWAHEQGSETASLVTAYPVRRSRDSRVPRP